MDLISKEHFINEIPGSSYIKAPTSEGMTHSITIIYVPENDYYKASISCYNNGEMQFVYNKVNEQNNIISLFEDSLMITSNTQGYFDEIS